jgi:hypothetical protein
VHLKVHIEAFAGIKSTMPSGFVTPPSSTTATAADCKLAAQDISTEWMEEAAGAWPSSYSLLCLSTSCLFLI